MRILFFYVLPIALAVWSLVDILQTPEERLRGMPKVLWVLLILLFAYIGPLAYIFAGKSREPGAARAQAGPSGRSLAPDDDPAFLEKLRLHKWEQDLKDRERKLREEDGTET